MAKLKISEFNEFYEWIDIINKGFSINNSAILFSSKMSYGVSVNLRKLKANYQSIIETINNKMQGFNDDLKALQEEYANKDKKGKPVVIKDKRGISVYDIPDEKLAQFEEKTKELNEKYKDEIAENNSFLASEDDFGIYTVTNESFPDLPQNIADKLYPMREQIE